MKWQKIIKIVRSNANPLLFKIVILGIFVILKIWLCMYQIYYHNLRNLWKWIYGRSEKTVNNCLTSQTSLKVVQLKRLALKVVNKRVLITQIDCSAVCLIFVISNTIPYHFDCMQENIWVKIEKHCDYVENIKMASIKPPFIT